MLLNSLLANNNNNSDSSFAGRDEVSKISSPEMETPFGDSGSNVVDGSTRVTQLPLQTSVDEGLFQSARSIDSDLIDFLRRPFPVVNLTLSIGDDQNTFGEYRPLAFMASHEPFSSKLKGRHLIKADIRCTLQVNANKFQQGRYILAWCPDGGIESGVLRDIWLKQHRFSVQQIVQLPHVEIDINKESQVELVIPYTSVYQGLTRGNASGLGDVGTVFLYPYSPLEDVSGVGTCSAVLFFSLENVQLGGLAMPQSGWNPRTRDVLASEAKPTGPVTSFFNKVRTTGNILSKVPLLSSFATTTSWAADIGANVASAWGWSRPSNSSAVMRVVQNPMSYAASANVVDSAQPLSLMADNHVKTMRGVGGTEMDEMAIDYLKKIPSPIFFLTWNITDDPNTLVANYTANVRNYETRTDAGATVYSMSPMAYIATMFRFWRGSITYTFKIMKTDFHSGRLLVFFNPGDTNTGSAILPSLQDATYVHRAIWDIRETTEFKFTVPYICERPWLSTGDASSVNNASSGTIGIRVLDRLVAPPTVSNFVNIIVEENAADDWQVSVPLRTTTMRPMIPYTQQSGWDTPISKDIGMIGNSTLSGSGLLESECCIGEHVTSLRQLLKRYSLLQNTTSANSCVKVAPFGIDLPVNTNNVGPIFSASTSSDLYNYIAPLYALGRGGVRHRFIPSSSSVGNQSQIAVLSVFSGNTAQFAATDSSETYNTTVGFANKHPHVYGKADLQAGLDVSTPMYMYTHARPHACLISNFASSIAPNWAGSSCPQVQVVYNTELSVTAKRTYRAGSDDLSFHLFCCVPPMVVE